MPLHAQLGNTVSDEVDGAEAAATFDSGTGQTGALGAVRGTVPFLPQGGLLAVLHRAGDFNLPHHANLLDARGPCLVAVRNRAVW